MRQQLKPSRDKTEGENHKIYARLFVPLCSGSDMQILAKQSIFETKTTSHL